MPRIILNMIVRNESRVIERCLRRVKPYIDGWVIVDTGSTDDTIDQIATTLSDLPGELHAAPWRNHGDNRNEALDLARKAEGLDPDYFLFIDADDTWEVPKDFAWPDPMDADGYLVRIRQNGTVFRRIVVASARLPWRYSGTAHAVLLCEDPHGLQRLDGAYIEMHSDGARRAGPHPTRKYTDDAAVFLKQLEKDPTDTRAMFYLAQSYRDSYQLELAAYWYFRRSLCDGWAEETYSAKYEYAKLQRRLAAPFETVRDAFLEAYRFRPTRAEPLLALAELFHGHGDLVSRFVYAAAAKDLPLPEDDILFVEETCYDWRALDEYSLAASKIGRNDLCAQAAEVLRTRPRVPDSDMGRIHRNLRCCRPAKVLEIEDDLDAVLESLCITILTGRRLPLLRRTLESLPAPILEKAFVVAYLNGRDDETLEYLNALSVLDKIIVRATDDPEPIAHAVERVIKNTPHAPRERPLIFHLEDDWECVATDPQFLLDGAKLLRDPELGQVRFRLAAEPTLPFHMVTRKPYSWRDAVLEGVPHQRSDAHFTFNPSLMRSADMIELFPADHEVDAARAFLRQGRSVAQLVQGAFKHIGGDDSLRLKMEAAPPSGERSDGSEHPPAPPQR